MKNNKKIIFGLGTGRCGTMSLSYLLNHQKNSSFSHELGGHALLPWKRDISQFKPFFGNILRRNADFVGDVSFYSLPYWEDILDFDSESKFVILKRNKQQTIESYIKKTKGQNPLMNHDGKKWVHYEWDKCYPKMEAKNKLEAISMYYDFYYEKCLEIPQESCHWIKTNDLNNPKKVIDLLKWCGFQDPEFVKFKKNQMR
jgi:hypothetical protein